jgi:DNA-binding response OmpR family regulator
VRGLEIGADDYITKPFSPAQLVARAQAVLRRTGSETMPRRLDFAGLMLDPDRHTVRWAKQEPVQLAPLEYKLLETFVLNAEQVLPINTLIDRVWGPDGADKAMLKQIIYRLRRKLESESSDHDAYIEAVPGIGYALMKRETRQR